jgi:hypothetical protein
MNDVPVGASLSDLAPMLTSNRRMVALTLSNVNGTPDAFAALGAALAANPLSLLSAINLSNNEIGDQGAVALATGLRALRTGLLAELNLGNTKIGEAGVCAILSALRTQNNLLQLSLTSNRVGGSGSAELAALLPNILKLETLSLGHTSLDPDTAFAPLAEAPEDPKHPPLGALSSLDLSGLVWAQGLLQAVARCGPKLTRLAMTDGPELPPTDIAPAGPAEPPTGILIVDGGRPPAGISLASAAQPPTGIPLAGAGLSPTDIFLHRLFSDAATRPSLDLDLSTPSPAALVPALLSALATENAPLPPSLALRTNGALGDENLVAIVEALTLLSTQRQPTGLRFVDLSQCVPPPAAAISVSALSDNSAINMLQDLAAASKSGSAPAALARWRLALPPGTEQSAALRIASVVALIELVRTQPSFTTLRLAGSFSSLSPLSAAPAFGVQLGELFRFGLANKEAALTELDISANRIGDEGICALAAALKINRTLAVLIMDNNETGVDGLKALNIALKGNKVSALNFVAPLSLPPPHATTLKSEPDPSRAIYGQQWGRCGGVAVVT